MPVYEINGERVEAVPFSTYANHPYTRQLRTGEFAEELGTDAATLARRAEEERAGCAALDQPGEEPLLVRPGDMIVSRPAEHGELKCEVVKASDFLAKAKYVGVPDPQLTAGMAASPEHAERRARRVDEDLDRQVAAREQRKLDAEAQRKHAEENPDRPEPAPKPTTGEPGSPQAATRGRPGEDGTPHDKREAKPQPAGADGNRSTPPDVPDPDAQRAQTHKAKAR
jgi:hypothetical protein